MQDHDGNDGTMVINARELLTVDDCESIIRSDGCLVGYLMSKKFELRTGSDQEADEC